MQKPGARNLKGAAPGAGDGASESAEGQGSFFESAQPLYTGHRERLRARFRDGGADALPDYELLEMVLFRAIPRRDTKDLAKRLLARFGSFAEVVSAPEGRLKEVSGVGDAVVTEIKLIRAAALRLMRSASVASSTRTCFKTRFFGSIVVSQSSLGFISPKPL